MRLQMLNDADTKRLLIVHAAKVIRAPAMNRTRAMNSYYYPDEVGIG